VKSYVIQKVFSDWLVVSDIEHNRCVITNVCGLARVLQEADDSFLAVLDRHTLAKDSLCSQEGSAGPLALPPGIA
jgi:DNA-binding IscR family transcriptional regulator